MKKSPIVKVTREPVTFCDSIPRRDDADSYVEGDIWTNSRNRGAYAFDGTWWVYHGEWGRSEK